jgi:hypothetical protein
MQTSGAYLMPKVAIDYAVICSNDFRLTDVR